MFVFGDAKSDSACKAVAAGSRWKRDGRANVQNDANRSVPGAANGRKTAKRPNQEMPGPAPGFLLFKGSTCWFGRWGGGGRVSGSGFL